MHCGECGFEFDEMNESQPICPGCGAFPRCRDDDLEIAALLLGESAAIAASTDRGEPEDDCPDNGEVFDAIRIPVDLQEAADDAEALLEAIGFATFRLPEGVRFFRLPTERIM